MGSFFAKLKNDGAISLCLIVGLVVFGFAPITAIAGDSKRFSILSNASMTLPEAIVVAQTKHDGYVVESELEEDDGMYFYQIELISNDGQAEVFINPANGIVLGVDAETGLAVRLKRRWEARLEAMQSAQISLADAIKKVRGDMEAFVVSAELRRRHHGMIYKIVLLEGEREHEFEVAIADGAILDHDIDD